MRIKLFGFEIVIRRPIPRNTAQVNAALWNRSPHVATQLGELNEAQLRNELYVIQHNLSIGLCAIMTQDAHRSILFHPRSTSPTVLTGRIID